MSSLLFPKFKSSAALQAGLYYARKNRRARAAEIAAQNLTSDNTTVTTDTTTVTADVN